MNMHKNIIMYRCIVYFFYNISIIFIFGVVYLLLDPILTLFMTTSMCVLWTRVPMCLRHGAKLKERGASVIVNKNVWERPYLSHVFYHSSRIFRQHVLISTDRIRYLLTCTHFPFVFIFTLFD